MNKLLFLHISTHLGGAEYSLLEILRNLSDKNIEIHLIFSAPYSLSSLEKISFVKFHPILLPYPKKRYTINQWYKFTKEIITSWWKVNSLVKKEKINIIYCNTFRSLLYCPLVKLTTSIQIVCHCRDNLHLNKTNKILYQLADKFIAVSDFIKSQLPEKKTKYLVYNGIQSSIYSKSTQSISLKQRYQLPDSMICIGNIGQIVPWKNQLDYLRVAQILLEKQSNLHFFVIGEFVDKDYYMFLQRIVKHWKIEKHVTFTGPFYPISDYWDDCILLIHTAIEEPFGRILIEAAACKKTVVAYDSGGPSEIIENGKTGFLIPKHDVKAMAEQVNHLIFFPQERTLTGQAAQERITKIFNSETNILSIYKILAL